MSMDIPTPNNGIEESNIKLHSPAAAAAAAAATAASPTNTPDFPTSTIRPESEAALVVEAKPEVLLPTPPLLLSSTVAAPKLRSRLAQDVPPNPEDSVMKCESMSPSDSYSVISSPRTFGWPPSESEESEPWTLHQELLPDQSLYAHSPGSPVGSWDCAVPYQFQGAPTSAGYYQDCSIPFSASTPSMQASYSPVFELASTYSSPQYPTSHYDDASPIHQASMSERGVVVNNGMAMHPDYSPITKPPTSDCYSTLRRSGSAGPNPMKSADINSLPYSQLLHLAFMSSETKRLQLRQIYDWFEENTNKTQSKGWQNSIRHNLSMNRAFTKAELKEDGTESRRSTEWVLQDWAILNGVQSTTRYRKGCARGKSSTLTREHMSGVSSTASRRALVGCSSRARDRLYNQRMPMQHMPSHTHMLYGSPDSSPHSVATMHGMPDVDGYMAHAGGICYSPSQTHEGYRAFVSEGTASGPDGYPLYFAEGSMGDYAVVGGVMQQSTPIEIPYGSQFPAALTSEQVSDSQHGHSHVPVEYSTRQGIESGPDAAGEWRSE